MLHKDPEAAIKTQQGTRFTRITPRTCLWPLTGSLLLTFGLSLGLTFRSDHYCYAGTCGEWLFPLQARLHVIIWYIWLSLSTTFLAVRAFHPEMQRVLARHLIARKIPFLGKSVSTGGLILGCWVACLYGIVVGVWWSRLHDYFNARNAESGISKGSNQLAAIALTGHVCDITMGMALLPISRHSALASFFKISASTTLTNHVLAAYTLFALVIIHGLLYVSWIPVFNSLSNDLQKVIPVLNPTYLYDETWPGNQTSLGIWRASLIFTGSVSALIMATLFVTTLPKVRKAHFNLFYFTHLLSIVMVAIVCLHASTMFYCTAPGLAMWVLDWGMRVYELRRELDGNIKALGQGWYCATVPLPRARLTGCSCRSPLAHFYLHHADSSIRELHPFTTITHLASKNDSSHASVEVISIQFLFRKQGKPIPTAEPEDVPMSKSLVRRLLRGKRQRIRSVQWTAKLADLADKKKPSSITKEDAEGESIDAEAVISNSKDSVNIALRLEGPYFTPADPYRYDTVMCMVAGTGISGALAIASAFSYRSAARLQALDTLRDPTPKDPHRPCWRRCIIIWSVKASDDIDLPIAQCEGLELRKFLTGPGRERVNLKRELEDATSAGGSDGQRKRTWVYVSGPAPFIAAGKDACTAVQKENETSREKWLGKGGLDFYAASWDP